MSNVFPTKAASRRLAIILEAPHPVSANEFDYTLDLLDKLLGMVGLDRHACFLGYVTHERTTTPERLKWDEVQVSLSTLTADLTTYQPHMILLFDKGGMAIRAFLGERQSADNLRGYVWQAKACAPCVKCLITYGLGRLVQEWGLTGVVRFDIAKAARELKFSHLETPKRIVHWQRSKDDIIDVLNTFRQGRVPLAVDIEGGTSMGPACVGFAPSASDALVVPFYDVDGCSIWSEEDELELWEAVQAVLEDPLVPKIIQNACYELFVLAWTTGIVVAGICDDTMLKTFELHAELEKSLEFQASIYTNQPYWKLTHCEVEGRYVPYKGDRRATTEEWMIYNGTDCCVTYEVNEVMERMLKPQQREHYRWNVQLLYAISYMSLRGLRYNEAEAKKRLKETREKLYELQDEINREASSGRPALQELYCALGAECSVQGQSVTSADGTMVRENLRQFYAGVEGVCALPSNDAEPGKLAQVSRGDLSNLLPLFASAFCRARRTEEKEVEEVSWQPMRWNGKKWVKDGKRVTQAPEAHECAEATACCEESVADEHGPNHTVYQSWFKPIRKTVTRNVPVEIKTFEDVRRFTKDSCLDVCGRAIRLVGRGSSDSGSGGSSQCGACSTLSPAQRGELATLLNLSININSTSAGGDAQWYVYEHCGAPKQFKKEKGRNTDKLTTSTGAVLAAYIATSDPRLATFMKWRSVDTRRENLMATADPDGRVRCSYTLPGTDTYRLSCSESPTHSGYNLQTVTEELRDLFPADEGREMGQFDLKGADGWTLAAECVRQGDNTMLLDLQAGIKPVNIIVLLYTEGPHINQLSREELLIAQKRVKKDSWQYIATKPIFYGYSYLMGARKMSTGIAEDSYAESGVATVVSPSKCEEIMRMIDLRYPGIRRWQQASARSMMSEGVLHTTVGWMRRFYGRKADAKDRNKPDRTTLGAWLGTLPQFNTTYATKMGLWRLWTDPENRRSDDSFIVEPLHTVHDSLNTQWRVEDREFARRKVLPEWFNNPMNCAGTELVIPASGTYGRSWGEQENQL